MSTDNYYLCINVFSRTKHHNITKSKMGFCDVTNTKLILYIINI